MKKTWALASLLLLPSVAFADVCSDLTRSLQDLYTQTMRVLSQTTDPDQQAAVRMSYDMQRDQLLAQMTAAGCTPYEAPDVDPTPPTDPDPDPVPPVEEPEDPDPVPPTDPEDPTEEPTDPTIPPTSSCMDQLDAYADLLRSQGVHQNDFVHKMKRKAAELRCGNYGNWQSHCAKKKAKRVECKKKEVKKASCKPKPKSCAKPSKSSCRR